MSGRPGQTFFLNRGGAKEVSPSGKRLALIRTLFALGALLYFGVALLFSHQAWFNHLRLIFWGILVVISIPLVIKMIFSGGGR